MQTDKIGISVNDVSLENAIKNLRDKYENRVPTTPTKHTPTPGAEISYWPAPNPHEGSSYCKWDDNHLEVI